MWKHVNLGIIGAMQEEVDALRDMMEKKKDVIIAGLTFTPGYIGDRYVVVVHSGVGKVNAAICATLMKECFAVTQIINTGVAGALWESMEIGDIVISTDALQHDVDATGCGCSIGQIPRMKEYSFPTDAEMADLAEKCCREALPNINVHRGRVLTGDQFICALEDKLNLRYTFGGLCAEMEGAAIAQVAYLNDIPCLIIRAISDKADESANEDYTAFEKKAIENSVKLLLAYIQNMP